MIKTYTAFTSEVDDIEDAIAEIKSQIDFDKVLLRNSVAIISCYTDFVSTGVYKAICDLLPCEVVGATTMASAVQGSGSEIMLTISLLTSDDVCFSTGLTDAIEGENDKPFIDAYGKAASKLDGSPSLILSYAPLLLNVGGDYFVEIFDKISGNVPNFGTLAVDNNEDYHEAFVLYNGQASPNQYAFILLSGNVNPKYYIANISNDKIFKDKGIVTASQGNQLQSVNNMPVIDYLISLGLEKDENGTIPSINSFPFVLDMGDGMMPVVRAVFALTPEGYAACGGSMPVGSKLSVSIVTGEDVIKTSSETLINSINDAEHSFMLVYSCIGRYYYLGYSPNSEIDKVKQILGEAKIPYQFAYSGCEICPVYSQEGKTETVNRSHNITMVICAF